MQRVNIDVENIPVGVDEFYGFPGFPFHFYLLQSAENSDAVVRVDDVVTFV